MAGSIPGEFLASGDVVQLRSGGAEMTVDKVENGVAHCVWMTPSGMDRSKAFALHLLRKGKPPTVVFMQAPPET